MKHTVQRLNLEIILLLIVLVLSTLFFLSRNVLLANGKLAMLQVRNNHLPQNSALITDSDQVALQQLIPGPWDVYFYDLRNEVQVVGRLLLQNETFTVEFFQSTEGEIRDVLRTNLFILRVSQGTFQCTMLDKESRRNLPFADEDTVADCFFTTEDISERRMLIKLKDVHGTPTLFLEHPVEPGEIRNWRIEKPVTTQ